MSNENDLKWDSHILRVFSVLAGISITSSFSVLSASPINISAVILSALAIFIVFDNWFHLTKELSYFDVQSTSEVIFYLMSLIPYACLPFIYGIRSNIILTFGPSEWMLLNLSILCLIDSTRKFISAIKLKKMNGSIELAKRKIIGSYFYYSLTGYFLFAFLFFFMFYTNTAFSDQIVKAVIVVLIWITIRIIDLSVLPIITKFYSETLLDEKR
jgi:hypothetical protein